MATVSSSYKNYFVNNRNDSMSCYVKLLKRSIVNAVTIYLFNYR